MANLFSTKLYRRVQKNSSLLSEGPLTTNLYPFGLLEDKVEEKIHRKDITTLNDLLKIFKEMTHYVEHKKKKAKKKHNCHENLKRTLKNK